MGSPASGAPRIAPQAVSAPQITPPAHRNFFAPISVTAVLMTQPAFMDGMP